MKPEFIHTFVAAALLGGHLIVKAAASDEVTLATAATDLLLGTTDQFGADAGAAVGIALGGIAEVKLGGTVAFGDPITADAASKGVKCSGGSYVGFALKAGVTGDVIPYHVAPGHWTATERAFVAAGNLGANVIVKAAADDEVALATAATDLIIGTTVAAADADDDVAVAVGPIANVKLGGTVAMGEPITADASGEGIKCEAAAGARYIGFALAGGDDGDTIPYRVAPGVLHEPAGG